MNNGGIKTVKAYTPNQILADVVMQSSVGIVVAKNESGVLKAGTPLSGDLTARNTGFTKVSESATAVGVLLHDVDATSTAANGTLLIFGVVNMDRLDATTAALITADIKAALPTIKFIK